MYKKLIWVIVFSFFMAVISLTTLIGNTMGASEPITREDPLVTKSYADRYIDERITYLENTLESTIENLTGQVAQLEQRVNYLLLTLGPSIRLIIDNRTAYIGTRLYILETAPFIVDGRTMVPFRFIGEALGAEIDWEPATRTVSYVLDGMRIEFPIDSTTITINGEPQTVDVPAALVNDRTFVPVRMLSEQLGADVNWNPAARQVTILR